MKQVRFFLGIVLIVVLLWLPNVIDDNIFFSSHLEASRLPDAPATLLFTGDIMLGRHIETLTNLYTPDYPFQKMAATLASVDAVIGNLEGPITALHQQTENGSFQFSFSTSTVRVLADHNVQYVTLANNHTGDLGRGVLAETKQHLEEGNILPFGDPSIVGNDSVVVTNIHGRKVALLGFNATYTLNEEKVIGLLRKTQEENKDAYIVVCMHWGEEYQDLPEPSEQRLGQQLIDNGADVVIGSHPHVVQGIEFYKGKPIFYSLGNFIFDQYFSDDVKEGLTVAVSLGKDKVEYDLLPVYIDRGQPRLMVGSERDTKLQSIADRSSDDVKQMILSGKIYTLW